MTEAACEAAPVLAHDRMPRRPRLVLPVGSCDCHAHIMGPAERYPYGTPRSYTPPDALLTEYLGMHAIVGVDRGVLVQPSVYGTDNRNMLNAMAVAGGRLRGVGVIDASIPEAELERMHAAGVRGVRFNLLFKGGPPMMEAARVAERIARLGWHLQFLIDVGAHPDLDRRFADFPVPVVIDHMGHMPAGRGTDDPGFRALLRLLDGGRCWVKLSAPYRVSGGGPPYADVVPIARALVERRPDRIVWGTDWPHPAIAGPMPNDGALVDLLADWVPDDTVRRCILVDNPAVLYDFPERGADTAEFLSKTEGRDKWA